MRALLSFALLAAADALRKPTSDVLLPAGLSTASRARLRNVMNKWQPVPAVNAGDPTLRPTDFGADPTGRNDSTSAFQAAIASLLAHNTSGHTLSAGIADLGGVTLDLAGGDYLVSQPLVIPAYYGNFRIIDGSLRASASFPPARFLIEIGSTTQCANGQGSCNADIGLAGLLLDGSQVAAGCIVISATMGTSLGPQNYLIGFTQAGIQLNGGHETMVHQNWVAQYRWDDPRKEKGNAIGIAIYGNDHYVEDCIMFSSRIGIQLTGAANIIQGAHCWNQATGNDGIGILNQASQNRFEGIYMDYTDLVLEVAQNTIVSDSYFLGGGQVVFKAPAGKPQPVFGVSIVDNSWAYGGTTIVYNSTLGSYSSVVDVVTTGNNVLDASMVSTSVSFTKVVSAPVSTGNGMYTWTADFSDVLIFPTSLAPIRTVSYSYQAADANSAAAVTSNVALPAAGASITIQTAAKQTPNGQMVITVDQSDHSHMAA